jgi:hypothetical protein
MSKRIFQMLTRKGFKSSSGRSVVLAAVAATALTAAGPAFAASPATAGSASTITDFSAARRHHHHGGGGAAAAAAFAGIVGTAVGAIAAANARDSYYDGPGYYAPAPAYYYGGPRYASPYGGGGYGYGYGGGGSYVDPGGNIIPY